MVVTVGSAAIVAMADWRDEQDYREGWDTSRSPREPAHPAAFCFREAGVQRFNDVVDDGYDERDRSL